MTCPCLQCLHPCLHFIPREIRLEACVDGVVVGSMGPGNKCELNWMTEAAAKHFGEPTWLDKADAHHLISSEIVERDGIR